MKTKKLLLHVILFVVIEILFIWFLFGEIPSVSFFTSIGIGHLLYFISLLAFGYLRLRSNNYLVRSMSFLLPIVLHAIIHVVVISDEVHDHCMHHNYDKIYLIVMAIAISCMVIIVEYIFHKKEVHCLGG